MKKQKAKERQHILNIIDPKKTLLEKIITP